MALFFGVLFVIGIFLFVVGVAFIGSRKRNPVTAGSIISILGFIAIIYAGLGFLELS